MSIINYFNKQKSLFDNINNKIKKYKKTFWLFEKLKIFKNEGKHINVNKKEPLSFSLFLILIFFTVGSVILTLGVFLLFSPKYLLSDLFFGSSFSIISLFSFYQGFRVFFDSVFFTQFSFRKFSKKEILILEKHGTKNINNINNILIYTLKRTKLKKEEFSDIIEIYNTYQSEIDTPVIFNIIKEKIINMYSEKEINKNELKTYTKYFMDNLNIANKTIIRESYLDIEKITFEDNENPFKEKNSIVF